MSATPEQNPKWADLKKPFLWGEIEIKPQSVSKQNSMALAVCYIDSRAAQDRLDCVFGPANWQVTYREQIFQGHQGYIAQLRIREDKDSDWVLREDVCSLQGQGDIDSLKGGASGAFKRVCSMFGLGRYLYEVDLGWLDCEMKPDGQKFKKWTAGALKEMESRYENNAFVRSEVETVEPAPAGIQPDPTAEADAIIKTLGKDNWGVLKPLLGSKSISVLVEARDAGAKTFDEFSYFVTNGSMPIENGRVGLAEMAQEVLST